MCRCIYHNLFRCYTSTYWGVWKLTTANCIRSTRTRPLISVIQCYSNRSFRYAAPHLWNKLPPSLRVPCRSATSECSPPLLGSDSAPKSVVGVSHGSFILVLKLTFSPDPFPVTFLSLSSLISWCSSRTCTEVSGVENIGQCGRLSQLSWLLGAL